MMGMRVSMVTTAVLVGAAICSLVGWYASPTQASHTRTGMTCVSERSGNEWYLKATGPGTVHSFTAQGRTVKLPQSETLGKGGLITLDWSGAYAPNPGKCTVR